MKIDQKFSVEYAYGIHFTRDVFGECNPLLDEVLGRTSKVVAVLDSGVQAAQPLLAGLISRKLGGRPPLLVAGGETCKHGVGFARRLVRSLYEQGVDRHSYVLMIGGGALLDAAGFAASLVHRGIRQVRVPTTVLSQCDSGVGVKNGVNAFNSKNFLGTFTPPSAVIVDFGFLAGVSDRDWRSGIAEAFKVAIIRDAVFLEFLKRQAPALVLRDPEPMEQVIVRCAQLHAGHIAEGGDPFEFGSARPLDFGHWSAHRLEVESRYRLNHGEAVAIGIALDLIIARNRGLIGGRECREVIDALKSTGLPVWDPLLEPVRDLFSALEDFRLHLGGELTLVMPQGVGRSCIVHELGTDEVRRAVEELKRHEDRRRRAFDVLPEYSPGRAA